MKMKTFFLKHAVAVAAIAIASLSLMSFGLSNATDQWFPVDENGIIDPIPLMGEPTDNCLIAEPAPTCAVQLPNGHTYEKISEVPTNTPRAGRVE